MRIIEVPNFITVLSNSQLRDRPWVNILHDFENAIFSLFVVLVISLIIYFKARDFKTIPGMFQNFIELIVEIFRDFISEILGKKNGEKYLPYIGSLFLFIFFNNLLGLVPFFKSSTSSFYTTISISTITFFYIQYVSIKENGIILYFYHLAGSPNNFVGWILSPLMMTLHIIGEISRPFSLALRLFGNIFGEDILLGAFVGLGVSLAFYLGLKIPFGFPFQFPFYFMALLTSFIQALVFALLTTVYFLLVLPVEEHK